MKKKMSGRKKRALGFPICIQHCAIPFYGLERIKCSGKRYFLIEFGSLLLDLERKEKKSKLQLVMGCEQNFRELSRNVISSFTICAKREP